MCPEEIITTIITSQVLGTYFKALVTPKWFQIHPKHIPNISFQLASLFEMRKRISEHCPEETITTDVLERRSIDPKATSAFSIDAAHAI